MGNCNTEKNETYFQLEGLRKTFIDEEYHNLLSMVMFTVINVLFIFNLEGIFNQIRSQN